MIRDEHFDGNGTLLNYSNYEYNDNGDMTKRITIMSDGTVQDSCVMEYDENGKLLYIYFYDGDSNMMSYLHYLYNDVGEQIGYEDYDEEGHLRGTIMYG